MNPTQRFLAGEGLDQGVAGLDGLVAQMIACGTNLKGMRAMTPMPKDAQELFDRVVVDVGLDRLVIAGDVIQTVPTFPLTNWLSVMELYSEKQAKVGDARRTMTPGARGERQLPDRVGIRIPIYATIDDFSLGIRTMMAAERSGAPLDTSLIEQATRRVNESIEDAFINGAQLQVGGNDAPGLLNAPSLNTQLFIDNESWTNVNHSGEDILQDVQNMITLLQQKKKYGPYNLYVPTEYGIKIGNDFKANSDKTIRQRLLELDEINSIKTADQLPGDAASAGPKVVMMQMTSDVVQAVVGDQPTPVSWQDGPGWNWHYAVMACIVPRVRDDYDNQSGVCVGQPS